MRLHKVPSEPVTAQHTKQCSTNENCQQWSGTAHISKSLFEVNYCRISVIKVFEIYLQWSCNSSNSLHQLQGKGSLSKQKNAWKKSILHVVKNLTLIFTIFLNANGVSTHNCKFLSLTKTRSTKLHKWDASLQDARTLRCNLKIVKINDRFLNVNSYARKHITRSLFPNTQAQDSTNCFSFQNISDFLPITLVSTLIVSHCYPELSSSKLFPQHLNLRYREGYQGNLETNCNQVETTTFLLPISHW